MRPHRESRLYHLRWDNSIYIKAVLNEHLDNLSADLLCNHSVNLKLWQTLIRKAWDILRRRNLAGLNPLFASLRESLTDIFAEGHRSLLNKCYYQKCQIRKLIWIVAILFVINDFFDPWSLRICHWIKIELKFYSFCMKMRPKVKTAIDSTAADDWQCIKDKNGSFFCYRLVLHGWLVLLTAKRLKCFKGMLWTQKVVNRAKVG